MTDRSPSTRGSTWLRALRANLRHGVASVRFRMLVGYLVLLAVALTIAIVVTRQVQHARADREIEREQAQEVAELRRLAGGLNPETGEPFGTDVEAILRTYLQRNVPSDDEAFYTVVGGNGFLYSNTSPPLFDDPQFLRLWNVDTPTAATTMTSVADIGEVRWLAVPLASGDGVAGVFVVASFPADDHREVGQVIRVITITGLAVLVVTSALAWTLAGRVLRPVRDLREMAEQINESDLSARIPVEGHDELARLGITFNEMIDRLEHGFNAQRRFLNDVAHELRTPITIARGHLEVLGDDPAERAETVVVVTDELDRMSRYVGDLLVLAKSEQANFLVTEPIDLGELTLDLYQRIRNLGRRSWVLDATPPAGVVTIVADPERISQAVVNLAANAVQHTDEDAEIGFGVAAGGNTAKLWVRDSGPGVDPAIIDLLFDRYARAATSRTRRPEGTGIGLSIVEAIARAHGGSVSVENRPGHGATFTVTVPLGGAPWAPPYAADAATPPSPSTPEPGSTPS